jgi:hypothetical protein
MANALGVDCLKLGELGGSWDDGGLWNDILWLSGRAWDATSKCERRLNWHHLVMAVGNFKRQQGRRLHPAHVAPANQPRVVPRQEFVVPGIDHVLIVDDPSSWQTFQLPGAGAATLTTLLAALWPDQHHILDWRLLAAVSALTLDSANDLGFVKSDRDDSLFPELSTHYDSVRRLLLEVARECALSLTTVERALYRLSQLVGSNSSQPRTWGQYRRALLVAFDAWSPPTSDAEPGGSGSADDEQDKPPDAP